MRLLIDGYNVIFQAGWVSARGGPHALERGRRRLVQFLANSLNAALLPDTTIVFDARQPPPRGVDELIEQQIHILFARQHETADEMIIELVRTASAPKQLTVVSSDHEIQRAVLRRGAKAIDAEPWLAALERKRQHPAPAAEAPMAKPTTPGDIEYWTRIFSQDADSGKLPDLSDVPGDIFPPGYASDLDDDAL